MRIHLCVVVYPLFSVDVPSSSKGIWLGPQPPRTEANQQIELTEVLCPSSLSTVKNLRRREVLEVFMVGNRWVWRNHLSSGAKCERLRRWRRVPCRERRSSVLW